MKRLLHAAGLALFFTHGAFAADAPPPVKPPTIAELQAQVNAWHDRYVMAAHDRDQAQADLANLKADMYAMQQAASHVPAPAK